MRSVLLVVGVAWLVGCDARSDPVAYEIDVPLGLSVDDRGRFLTAAAAEQLDASGFFTLPQREPGVPGRQLSRREAIDAAGFVGRVYGKWFAAKVAHDRGGVPIDHRNLAPCGPAYLAQSPYASNAAPTTFHAKHGGAYWLTTLCAGDAPVVFIAISVMAEGLVARARDTDAQARIEPADFLVAGIPDDDRSVYLPTPEDVTRIVAAATGRRVADTPVLYTGGYFHGPYFPRWRVTLDAARNVTRRDDAESVSTSVVYFGRIARNDALRPTLAIDAPAETPRDAKAGVAERVQPISVGGGS